MSSGFPLSAPSAKPSLPSAPSASKRELHRAVGTTSLAGLGSKPARAAAVDVPVIGADGGGRTSPT